MGNLQYYGAPVDVSAVLDILGEREFLTDADLFPTFQKILLEQSKPYMPRGFVVPSKSKTEENEIEEQKTADGEESSSDGEESSSSSDEENHMKEKPNVEKVEESGVCGRFLGLLTAICESLDPNHILNDDAESSRNKANQHLEIIFLTMFYLKRMRDYAWNLGNGRLKHRVLLAVANGFLGLFHIISRHEGAIDNPMYTEFLNWKAPNAIKDVIKRSFRNAKSTFQRGKPGKPGNKFPPVDKVNKNSAFLRDNIKVDVQREYGSTLVGVRLLCNIFLHSAIHMATACKSEGVEDIVDDEDNRNVLTQQHAHRRHMDIEDLSKFLSENAMYAFRLLWNMASYANEAKPKEQQVEMEDFYLSESQLPVGKTFERNGILDILKKFDEEGINMPQDFDVLFGDVFPRKANPQKTVGRGILHIYETSHHFETRMLGYECRRFPNDIIQP